MKKDALETLDRLGKAAQPVLLLKYFSDFACSLEGMDVKHLEELENLLTYQAIIVSNTRIPQHIHELYMAAIDCVKTEIKEK